MSHRYGSNHPQAKLTEGDVRKIMSLLKMGVTQTVLAKQFGVRQATIWKIKHGLKWKHVK